MNLRLAIRHKSLFVVLVVLLASALIGATTATPFPESIPLPVGFQPAGIASGAGTTFFVGSILTGAIYRGNFTTGEGQVFIEGLAGRAAIGLKYDARSHLLFVAGG